jgi:hypothetical protein
MSSVCHKVGVRVAHRVVSLSFMCSQLRQNSVQNLSSLLVVVSSSYNVPCRLSTDGIMPPVNKRRHAACQQTAPCHQSTNGAMPPVNRRCHAACQQTVPCRLSTDVAIPPVNRWCHAACQQTLSCRLSTDGTMPLSCQLRSNQQVRRRATSISHN